MSKYLIILTIFFLSSCGNKYLDKGESKIDPATITTAEVLTNMDTTKVYHVYVKNDNLYVVNKDTRLVEYYMIDTTGVIRNIIFFILFVVFIVLFMSFFGNRT